MSTKLSAGRVRSTYKFIKTHREHYSVQAMCRILGVAPSGYTSGSRTRSRTEPRKMPDCFA